MICNIKIELGVDTAFSSFGKSTTLRSVGEFESGESSFVSSFGGFAPRANVDRDIQVTETKADLRELKMFL